jgi:lactate dehydrogenase-like 2-hydroxyacid dehydrogenase
MKPVVLIEIDKKNMPEDVTEGLKPFAELVYQNAPFGEILKEAVCMMVGGTRIDSEFLDEAPKLRLVARFGVGYDVVDVNECIKRRVYVTHTPGVLSEAVADHAWALILGFMRRIPEADQYTRTSWAKREASFPFGWDMNGKVLGIIGLGRIGAEVLKRSQGFGTVNIYYDVVRNKPLEDEYGVRYVSLDELLRTSDIITIHVPLLPSTRRLLGEKEFNIMKKTAIVVNTSRGQVIDEEALTRALLDERIRGAALDVFEHEPTPLNNPLFESEVVVSPHCASATWETRRMMAESVTENVMAYLKGDRPPNVVPEQEEYNF